MFGSLFKKKPPSLQQQLDDLASCGVKLLPDATAEGLLEEWSQAQFDEDPYGLAVVALGNDEQRRSVNLWHFDTECVEDHGAYARIAEEMRRLAGDDLPLSDVEDFVDVEAKQAWLSFKLDGSEHRWTCEVENDWVDPTVMSRFGTLLEQRKTGRRFTYLDLGGQDCIIGCFTEVERERLCRVTGLAWKWLT